MHTPTALALGEWAMAFSHEHPKTCHYPKRLTVRNSDVFPTNPETTVDTLLISSNRNVFVEAFVCSSHIFTEDMRHA
jgi:hypothetical protein